LATLLNRLLEFLITLLNSYITEDN